MALTKEQTDRFADVNGIKIHYNEAGSGPALIAEPQTTTVVPPNAPGLPRAIPHATCGPVHASVTCAVASSTRPVATSPALPHHTFTCHERVSAFHSAAVVSPNGLLARYQAFFSTTFALIDWPEGAGR